MPHASDEYRALTDGVGSCDLSDFVRIEMAGRDAVSFLHNLCTQDLKRLNPGEGCEAFITNVQGKIVGHLVVLRPKEGLVLLAVPGDTGRLIGHLDRYCIREDVQFIDRSSTWGIGMVAGAASGTCLTRLVGALPADCYDHRQLTPPFVGAFVARVAWGGPAAFVIYGDREAVASLAAQVTSAGGVQCSREALDVLRIEQGWPWYGRDMTDQNLPQEIGRDARAISFTKGCYLGQETVARIDARGHVNWHLVGVCFDGDELPAADLPLENANTVVGRVTSAVHSPRAGGPLAWAYVRRGFETPGTRLQSTVGPATVVRLPIGGCLSEA